VRTKDAATLLVSVATLLGAVGAFWEKVKADDKDRAFAWDNLGDQVAEVERLKERLARIEAVCQIGGKPVQSGLIIQGNDFGPPGVANILVKEPR